MKKSIALIILCFSLSILVKAQSNIYTDSLARRYDRNTIYLKSFGFEKDGRITPYGGPFKFLLKKELQVSPIASREFKRFTNNKWAFLGCYLGGTALMLSGIESNRINRGRFWGGLGIMAISIPFSYLANDQMNRAVWLYNRDAVVRR
jgi:hypothetical protein